MKARAVKLVAAIIASILSSASAFAAPEIAAPDGADQRPDTCLTSPREYAPPGTRWRYRVERGSGRHCWFLKDDAEKTARKPQEQSTAATEEPVAAPRKKAAAPRTLSDAHAEFSQTPVEPDTRPAPAPSAPAPVASAAPVDGNQASTAKSANNMLAPTTATRWPDPMATVKPPAAPPAAPADQNAEALPAAATAAAPAAKPQAMPRAVPPMPASEKPMSLPMLITIVAGGLSVLGVLVSLLFAWIASRRARLSPIAPMPPLEMPDRPDAPRRPGDLYRQRKKLRAADPRHAA